MCQVRVLSRELTDQQRQMGVKPISLRLAKDNYDIQESFILNKWVEKSTNYDWIQQIPIDYDPYELKKKAAAQEKKASDELMPHVCNSQIIDEKETTPVVTVIPTGKKTAISAAASALELDSLDEPPSDRGAIFYNFPVKRKQQYRASRYVHQSRIGELPDEQPKDDPDEAATNVVEVIKINRFSPVKYDNDSKSSEESFRPLEQDASSKYGSQEDMTQKCNDLAALNGTKDVAQAAETGADQSKAIEHEAADDKIEIKPSLFYHPPKVPAEKDGFYARVFKVTAPLSVYLIPMWDGWMPDNSYEHFVQKVPEIVEQQNNVSITRVP